MVWNELYFIYVYVIKIIIKRWIDFIIRIILIYMKISIRWNNYLVD